MAREFVGQGWAFPVHADATGRIALASDEREIEESIRLILATAPGERPMRPEFGCAVHDFVFAPADASTAGAIGAAVRAALRFWEPRIDVDRVAVSLEAADDGVLLIDVGYTILGTNDPRNLVFPFYVIPREAEAATSGSSSSSSPSAGASSASSASSAPSASSASSEFGRSPGGFS
ncbi:GPW/gp25 family protein [Agromyces intestinalis]|uniref:GPW/gp25 family protein n=1 Tax=Agromyces intestinalis TaxID=2592652 RepID=A0A5C1YDB3_9MICO|nr:GPW/gp25 family protein [Agromyces intestinalis]QEO14093.1 GPW/gp25 family protein [Agromyces intestinalis]